MGKIFIFALAALICHRSWAVSNVRKPAQLFNLECGTYKAFGRFGLNSKQLFVLSIAQNSFSPAELLVIGGNVEEKIRSLNKMVLIEFYVPELISGTSGKNVVFLQSISLMTEESNPAPELIQREQCGLNEKFRK